MSAIEIKFFGIGSAEIITDKITVLIDAFGEFVKDIHPAGKNLILITHNDNDHFLPLKVAKAAIDTKSKVIGPPGIAYPLLVDGNLPPEQLEIIFPVHLKKPVEKNIDGINLKVYQTKHFNDWEPDHVSYLIEIDNKKIYVTGDSNIIDTEDESLKNLDAIFYSIVGKDKNKESTIGEYIDQMEYVIAQLNPRYLLPTHLINCEWSISPSKLKMEIERSKLKKIMVLENESFYL